MYFIVSSLTWLTYDNFHREISDAVGDSVLMQTWNDDCFTLRNILHFYIRNSPRDIQLKLAYESAVFKQQFRKMWIPLIRLSKNKITRII